MPYIQGILAGLCGGVLVYGLPWPGTAALPGIVVAVVLAALPLHLCLLPAARRGRPGLWALLLGMLGGALWGGLAHQQALALRLPVDGPRDGLALTVRLEGEPERVAAIGDGPAWRFAARILDGVDGAGNDLAGRRLRLTWYQAPRLAAAETWRLRAVVGGPWSYANPGGFDYERWLLGNGLHGTGWVRGGERLAAARPGHMARARAAVATGVAEAGLQHEGVVMALLLGRADGIGDDLWDVLRRTATVHLLVISGLHVSLATALGVLLGRLLVRACPPLLIWFDARRGGCVLGALAAAGYVALAGAGLPALRALVMGVAVLVLLTASRRGGAGSILLLALTVVLLMEPLAVHRQGFWLSFAAVAILLLMLSQRPGQGWARRLLGAQFALSIGMLPLVALLTGTLPWMGVPANLLAVPLVSLGVVPLCLLAGLAVALWAPAAAALLIVADWLLSLVIAWLSWLAAIPASTVSAAAVALFAAQAALLCLIGGLPRRYWAALVLCAALPAAGRQTGVAPGHYRVTALDVGQGTAVMIDTWRHRLLYDAGPGFPSGFDTGSAVVVPSLAATGPLPVDVLVMSHDDLDHTGGTASVLARAGAGEVLAGGGDGPGRRSCHGRRWRWDGVEFHMLAVQRPVAPSDNDRSCILLVDDGRQRALLAGDIGSAVEARLLRKVAAEAPLSLMFAPHHGSASSSSRALVRVLRPRIVFVSAGRSNRFGHPHPDVVARYRRVGARLYRSGWEGALVWSSQAPERVQRWRARLPYWRDGPPAGS